MKVLKIALTGGPCGGKTTSISAIEEEFSERGYHVIIVPEAATILINSGIRPFGKNGLSMYDFQKFVMKLQLQLEEHAEHAASMVAANTIILCDRGLLDDKAYVSDKEFQTLVDELGTTQFDLLSRYDLVMHLVTAANGKEEFYTTANNVARTETPEEAREKDQKTLESWLGHDNLKIIGNDASFSTKIANTIREIHQLLDSPYPIQRQEKYLVESVDFQKLQTKHPVLIEIEQYVEQTEIGEVIYRKSTKDNETKYTKISKIDTKDESERIVRRKNITEDEYLSNIPEDKLPIKKQRYCFTHLNQYFRLDIFDDGLTLLEIEDTNKTKTRAIPTFIKVSDEVTTAPNYRNCSLYLAKNSQPKTFQKKS